LDPFSFLSEECNSVLEALNETLRHDYGPERSLKYFTECKRRLDSIRDAIEEYPKMDRAAIAAHMRSLGAIGSRISLIERSHLGEFSWPFAEAIREIAETLFIAREFDETLPPSPPIVHVVAEGTHYQIVDDALAMIGEKRIVVVAFPRQLKHHVLLHSIFGHELGHTALQSNGPGMIISTQVMPALVAGGVLQDTIQATAWLKRDDAPPPIREAVTRNPDIQFLPTALQNWRIEIICDLFGLLLFGPAFAAAHRTILEALSAHPTDFDMASTTHPPYLIRRRVITSAIRVLGWDKAVTLPKDELIFSAERELLNYVTEDTGSEWYSLFSNHQLQTVIDKLASIFAPYPRMAFDKPDRDVVRELVERLTLNRPPIMQTLDDEGFATSHSIPTCHCLYAGWTFWFGRKALHEAKVKQVPLLRELSFLELNRLCDMAILQQRAIDATRAQ
jgi:hypothetical protein